MPCFILSTVGISLLTNPAEGEWRRRLTEVANVKGTLPSDVEAYVHLLEEQVAQRLRQGSVSDNRRMSAELNGLYALHADQLYNGRGNLHYLVTTDTVLGRLAASLVQDYLRDQGLTVDVYYPDSFAAGSPTEFSHGIKELIHWCEETIPGYQQNGYEVVFNLTGGFKSLQGYLNIIGMFYADRIVYIFERSDALLTIPRLPLKIDLDVLRGCQVSLELLKQGHVLPLSRVSGIPEGLLEEDGESVTLSDWGLLTWNRARIELLGQKLLQFPHLEYTETFRKEFKAATMQQRIDLQGTLAKVESSLETYHGDPSELKRDGGLQYDVYSKIKTTKGEPIGHFRLDQGRRVSCVAAKGKLYLRHFGEHDQVNDNP